MLQRSAKEDSSFACAMGVSSSRCAIDPSKRGILRAAAQGERDLAPCS
jgi:hypothetical protein